MKAALGIEHSSQLWDRMRRREIRADEACPGKMAPEAGTFPNGSLSEISLRRPALNSGLGSKHWSLALGAHGLQVL